MEPLCGGYFVLNPGAANELRIKNTMVKDGAELILGAVFQDTAPFDTDFFLGLTNATYTYESASLASIAAEEPVGNGYARQQLTRDNVDWTVSLINGIMRVQSKLVTFTASGNWNKQWSRMFIVDEAASKVISLSGPTPAPLTVLTGQGPSVQYEYYLPR